MATTEAFPGMKGHKYMFLTTFRKSGAAVGTPVWFAHAGDRIYMRTEEGTGKLKRTRNNPRVQVAPSTFKGKTLGPAADGTIRRLSGAEGDLAREALRRHYPVLMRVFGPLWKMQKKQDVWLEIVPATDTPAAS